MAGMGAPTVAIRPATEDDIPRILELFVHGSLRPGKEDPTDLDPYRAALADISRGPGGVLVAEVEGQVVGVCQLIVFRHLQTRGGLCAEVESVHVHPDHRRHGVGRVLMAAALERARSLGCYRLQLTSNVARPEAHRFYEALGFEPSHRGFKLILEGVRAEEPPPEVDANPPPSGRSD
jgi:GNAT superfamily N-acetyltransferase